MLGFLLINKEQLRFNPTILTLDGKRYIKVVRNNQTKRLILNKLIKRAPYITGQATTCQKAHYKGNTSKIPLVIKDLQQYLERKEEGKLLYKAVKKGVINIARYYYYRTIYIGGQNNNIFNICKGLDITKAINHKPKSLIVPLSVARVQGSIRKG